MMIALLLCMLYTHAAQISVYGEPELKHITKLKLNDPQRRMHLSKNWVRLMPSDQNNFYKNLSSLTNSHMPKATISQKSSLFKKPAVFIDSSATETNFDINDYLLETDRETNYKNGLHNFRFDGVVRFDNKNYYVLAYEYIGYYDKQWIHDVYILRGEDSKVHKLYLRDKNIRSVALNNPQFSRGKLRSAVAVVNHALAKNDDPTVKILERDTCCDLKHDLYDGIKKLAWLPGNNLIILNRYSDLIIIDGSAGAVYEQNFSRQGRVYFRDVAIDMMHPWHCVAITQKNCLIHINFKKLKKDTNKQTYRVLNQYPHGVYKLYFHNNVIMVKKRIDYYPRVAECDFYEISDKMVTINVNALSNAVIHGAKFDTAISVTD